MGFYKGPRIVRDGLVLALDAGSKRSYPGTGNSIFDLSGNSHNGIITGATYDSDFGGSLVFGSTTYNRITISDYFMLGATSLSMSAWFMITGGAGTNRCVVHKGTTYTIGNSEYWTGFRDNNIINSTIGAGFGAPGTYDAGSTGVTGELNTWYNTCSVWNGSNVRVFLNGEFKVQYTLGSFTPLSNVTRIGSSADSSSNYQVVGNIANVLMYKDYTLSDTQVLQNFNAHKSRFGL